MRNLHLATLAFLACLIFIMPGCGWIYPFVINRGSTGGGPPFSQPTSYRPDFIPTSALPWAVNRWTDRTDQVGWITTWGSGAAQCVVVDKSGNVYVVGHAGGPIDFNPGSGIEEINDRHSGNEFNFFSKYGPRGEYFWTINLGMTFFGITDMVIGKSGDIFLTGISSGNQYFVARYNPDGNRLWKKMTVPVTDRDAVPHIAVDRSENVYLVGSLNRQQNFNTDGPAEMRGDPRETDQGFVTSFSASGKYRWVQVWITDVRNPMKDVAVGKDGDIFILCQSKSEAVFNDAEKPLKAPPMSLDGRSFVLDLTSGGSFIGVGPLDPAGDCIGERIESAPNGNFHVLGLRCPYISARSWGRSLESMFVKELTFDGEQVFEVRSNEIKTSGTCYARAFDLAPNGDIAVAGVYKDSVTFGAGTDAIALKTDYQWNDYVMSMNRDGKVRWVRHWGESPKEQWNIVPPVGVAIAKDSVFVCGDYKGRVDFDSSVEQVIRSSVPGFPSVLPDAVSTTIGEGDSGITAYSANGPATLTSDAFLLKLSNSGNYFEGAKGIPSGPRIDAVAFSNPASPNYTRRFLGKWDVTADLSKKSLSIKEDMDAFNRLKIPASDIPPSPTSCVSAEFIKWDAQTNRATFRITLSNPFPNLLGYSGRAIILADDKYDLKSDEGYTSLWDETDKEVAYPMFGFPVTSVSDPYPWFDPGVRYSRELTFTVPTGTSILPFTIAADMSAPGPPMDPAAITGTHVVESTLPDGRKSWDVTVRAIDAQYDIPDVQVINSPFLSFNPVALPPGTMHEWYFSNDNHKPPGEYEITIKAISGDAPDLPMYLLIPITVK